jgi:carboxyl-terminal processing protease
MREGRYTIIAPIKDTPAERAGIKSGDVILEVDGKSTSDMTFLEMIFAIRGPKGTEVEIVILPKLIEQDAQRTFKIIRDTIPMLSVELDMLGDREDIAYIELSGYLENTDESLKENIEQAIEQGAVGLILDLRNNPGGLVTTTINIVSQFIESGVVFYEVNGSGDRKDWHVKSGEIVTDLPMVVLVNEYSASASEITAGALQEHGRATIIGTKTFGKGSVNILRQLDDGSGLFFSIAHWFTPEGVSIEGQGISPDIEVPTPDLQFPPDIDVLQLQRAIEYLRTQVKISK